MRILLASSGSGSRGGGEIFLQYLAAGLSRQGQEILLWLPRHPRMDGLAKKCAAHASIMRADYNNTYDYRLRSLAHCFQRANSRRIAAEWTALSPDVIHVNKQNLEDGLDLLSAAELTGKPSLTTIHITQSMTYLGSLGAPLRDFVARRALRSFSGSLVSVLENRRGDLVRFLGHSERARVILNGVPLPDIEQVRAHRSAMRRALGVGDETQLVMAVGRMAEQKDPFQFLEVARAVHRLRPATRFVWVGDGELRCRWERAALDLGVADYVWCAGWREDAAELMGAADVFFHVAKFEGLPLALIEAMAVGLPCVLARSLFSDLQLFSESDVMVFDDVPGLVSDLSDFERLNRIAENGRTYAEMTFGVDAMAKNYANLYREMISTRPSIDEFAPVS